MTPGGEGPPPRNRDSERSELTIVAEQGPNPESALEAAKRDNDLRVRKRFGPGSHNQDAANPFSPNKNGPRPHDRSARFEPTDRCGVTATADGTCFAVSTRGRQPTPVTGRFPARKPLSPAE